MGSSWGLLGLANRHKNVPSSDVDTCPAKYFPLLQLRVFPWKFNPHVLSWLLTSECCWADASSHLGSLLTKEPVVKIHMFCFLPFDLQIMILNFN